VIRESFAVRHEVVGLVTPVLSTWATIARYMVSVGSSTVQTLITSRAYIFEAGYLENVFFVRGIRPSTS
jgi:hypothetical protein